MRTNSRRLAALVQWLSIVVILAALVVLVRALPVNRGIEALSGWAAGLGVIGPVVIGAIYIVASLIFVPGSALTLGSGALFGPLIGTITVSLASTTAAAFAFLIARYLARKKVEEAARRYPRFSAIDRAIGEGGWKIIALLRLSPVVPFSLSNYLFGLTAIRFWPCVLASWIAMLPGTFMYVYLGYIGRESVAAAADTSGSKSLGQWIMLIVGFAATVVVTVYVTRLAARALKRHTEIDSRMEPSTSAPPDREEAASTAAPAGWPRSATISAVLAVALSAAATGAMANRNILQSLFGPVRVTLAEAYGETDAGPSFDHSVFNALLKRYVDADGWVDYAGLKAEASKLNDYLEAVGAAPFEAMGRSEKLALLINGYNAFTLRLILDHYPEIKSIKDIPSEDRWYARRWKIAGKTLSLDDIENKEIRPKFREPRVHFALVCAAIGCPKLRNEAYRGDRISEQLEDQARYVHSHDRWFRYKAGADTVDLTALYNWYGDDFKQTAGSVLAFAAQYSPDLKKALDAGRTIEMRWLDYDWTLNDKKNAG